MNLTSDSVTNLLPAFVAAQSAFGKAAKTARNDHFGSAYTPLDSVLEAIVPALNANALGLSQHTVVLDTGVLALITRITHVTGEWLASEYPIIPSRTDPQGYASALTYGRRNALLSLVGVAPTNEDDDGNSASWSPKSQKGQIHKGYGVSPRHDVQAETLAAELADAIDSASTSARLDELVPSLQSVPTELRAPLRERFSARRAQLRGNHA